LLDAEQHPGSDRAKSIQPRPDVNMRLTPASRNSNRNLFVSKESARLKRLVCQQTTARIGVPRRACC
jgi:hypothetical protein